MGRPATDCGRVEAALSARHDGEEPGLPPRAIASHLSACASCRAFAAALDRPAAVLRPLRRVPEPSGSGPPGGVRGPTLVEQVTQRAAREDRAGVWWALRALLVLVALGYLGTAVPELLFAADAHHAHLARHLGAFEAAYAVALVFVAARPAKARAMVPFTVALAVVMAVAMVVDLLGGHAFPLGETTHLLEVAGLILVWLLATRRGWPGRRLAGSGRPSSPGDRVSDRLTDVGDPLPSPHASRPRGSSPSDRRVG